MVLVLLMGHWGHAADAVDVTITADETSLDPGETTTVRVFRQVVEDMEADALRILTWYLDILVEDIDDVLVVNWASMSMSASDSIDGSSATSSTGVLDASGHRRGIYNTFTANPTQTPGPGLGSPVELLTFEVTATGRGKDPVRDRCGI